MAIKKLQQGFTLIELLVVMAIFAIVSGVLLFNYSGFNNSVAITNLSEQVGLTVRQAQSYATSVHSLPDSNGTPSDTFPAYGISFSVNSTATPFNPDISNFVLFADASPDGKGDSDDLYENNGTCGNPAIDAECLENFGIQSNDTISSLCYAQTGTQTCMTTSGTINVVFRRPNPDAEICVVGTPCTGSDAQLQSYVYVTLKSPQGVTRTVKIYETGQISIE